MVDLAKLYKKISLDIIDKLEKHEIDEINELLDKRQELLESVSDAKLFKSMLIQDGILDIDKQIHNLLTENISKVKDEIKIHKKSKQANNSYMNFTKQKLNIFNEKV